MDFISKDCFFFFKKEANTINQKLYCKIRELYDENDRIKEENAQLKYQLEIKAKKEATLENKVKALEKLVCITPSIKTLPSVAQSYKENIRPPLPTPTTTTTDSEVINAINY